MKTTADRIKEGMKIRGLRQADLVEKTGISKGALSSYISGRYVPKQNNTYLIAKALNVNEAWLMGEDVPMERNYEDQTLLRFEQELEDACKIIENGGYIISFSDNPNDDIIMISNQNHESICCMHEYELVNKYESLKRKDCISADLLVETDLNLLEKYKEARRNYVRLWNIQFFENKMLQSFSQLSDENKKKSIAYTENLLSNQKMEEALIINAAHERTDLEVTDEMRKHDDDIMDDENF